MLGIKECFQTAIRNTYLQITITTVGLTIDTEN